MLLNGVLGVLAVILLIGLWSKFTTELYRIFFWDLFFEAITFLLLKTFSITYRSNWEMKSRKLHIFIGSLASFFSIQAAFLINAAWAFMMIPGKWLTTYSHFDAVFNPILFESFSHLLIPCLLNTAVIIFFWTYYKTKTSTKKELSYYEKLNKLAAKAVASLVFLQPISGILFFLKIKGSSEFLSKPYPYDQIVNGVATPFFITMISLATIAITFAALFWLVGYKRGRKLLIITGMVLLLAFVAGAFTRERARKPYLIHSYMPMNMRIVKVATLQKAKTEVIKKHPGEKVYKDQGCTTCHRIKGKGGTFGPTLDSTKDKYSNENLRNFLQNPPYGMPPFDGNAEELDKLVKYLLAQ
jgi:cytochrome bd-type quinol oxidase subunit 1